MTADSTIADLRGLPAADLFARFNAWPTLAAQSIRITDFADDFTSVDVRLDLTPENANYMGTAFGGSLFSMLDPFLVVPTINQLGNRYAVWDIAAEIAFLRPGTGPVTAHVSVPSETVAEMRRDAMGGKKVLRWFEIDIVDDDGQVVARARRQLYVRERRDIPAPA